MINPELEFFGEDSYDLVPWSHELNIDVTVIPEPEMNHSVLPYAEEHNYLGWFFGTVVACGSFVTLVNYYIE